MNSYIVVEGTDLFTDFLVEFGGVEQGRGLRPDGRIDHGDRHFPTRRKSPKITKSRG